MAYQQVVFPGEYRLRPWHFADGREHALRRGSQTYLSAQGFQGTVQLNV
jgi:hypothetical protein